MAKIKTIIIIVLSIALALMTTFNVYVYCLNKLPQRDYQHIYRNKPYFMGNNLTHEECVDLVANIIKIPHKLKYKQLNKGWGRSNILFREVQILGNLNNEYFILTYTHELMHLKYWCVDEMNTSYRTFVFLYESDNEILHNVGVRYMSDVLYGEYQGKYDCGYYILEYLNRV